MNDKIQWYYRGTLRSCNYSCTYCPFSKHADSFKEQEKDKRELARFTERFSMLLKEEAEGHAVFFMPYGEALLHPYYWHSLAKLSLVPAVEAVGAQTNAAFPVNEMLDEYLAWDGKIEKLR